MREREELLSYEEGDRLKRFSKEKLALLTAEETDSLNDGSRSNGSIFRRTVAYYLEESTGGYTSAEKVNVDDKGWYQP